MYPDCPTTSCTWNMQRTTWRYPIHFIVLWLAIFYYVKFKVLLKNCYFNLPKTRSTNTKRLWFASTKHLKWIAIHWLQPLPRPGATFCLAIGKQRFGRLKRYYWSIPWTWEGSWSRQSHFSTYASLNMPSFCFTVERYIIRNYIVNDITPIINVCC